jgi:hypothetical protein
MAMRLVSVMTRKHIRCVSWLAAGRSPDWTDCPIILAIRGKGCSSEVDDVGDPLSVAITGLDTYWGLELAERLLASERGLRIVGLDLRRPPRLADRIDFHRVDLTDPGADGRITEILVGAGVEAIVHLAFRSNSRPASRGAPVLETVGGRHVMNACAAAKVRRLVVLSSTMLYGPRADNPNFLSESHALRGHPDATCVTNRVELEAMLARSATNQERELEMTLGTLMAVVEPLMVILMGGMVLIIVLAVLLPIFQLNTMVN